MKGAFQSSRWKRLEKGLAAQTCTQQGGQRPRRQLPDWIIYLITVLISDFLLLERVKTLKLLQGMLCVLCKDLASVV